MIGELIVQASEAESNFGAEFAGNLLDAVKNRIVERRNSNLSTLHAYLQDATFLDATADLHLTYASRNEVAKEAGNLIARLYPESKNDKPQDGMPQDGTPEGDNPDEPDVQCLGPTPPKRSRSRGHDLSGHLKENKAKRAERGAARSASTLFKIHKEMETFETTGKRPDLLQKVLHCSRHCLEPIIFNKT